MLHERYGQAALLFVALLVYSATGYMYFEFSDNPDLNWADAFWWSIVTMTTVGYGDFFPSTFGGRWFVGMPTMVLGIGLLGYILSLIATFMLESKSLELKGMKTIHCADHVVICEFGSESELLKLIGEIQQDQQTCNSDIVIIDDSIDELPASMQVAKVHFVRGDSAQEAVLHRANVGEAHAVIIQSSTHRGSDDRNLKIALAVKSYSPSVFLIAECENPENVRFLRQAKCDSVLCVSTLSEQMLVQELLSPGVGGVISQLTSNTQGKQFYIVDMPGKYENYRAARKANSSAGRVPVGIHRNGDSSLLPEDDFAIESGDQLILIASHRPV
jgi:voltage-gated potassium channel